MLLNCVHLPVYRIQKIFKKCSYCKCQQKKKNKSRNRIYGPHTKSLKIIWGIEKSVSESLGLAFIIEGLVEGPSVNNVVNIDENFGKQAMSNV